MDGSDCRARSLSPESRSTSHPVERKMVERGGRVGRQSEVRGLSKVKEWTVKKPAQISEDLPLEAHQKETKTPRREGGCEEKGKNEDGLVMEGLGGERSRG